MRLRVAVALACYRTRQGGWCHRDRGLTPRGISAARKEPVMMEVTTLRRDGCAQEGSVSREIDRRRADTSHVENPERAAGGASRSSSSRARGTRAGGGMLRSRSVWVRVAASDDHPRVRCQVIAQALIPRKPGEHVKTNRRDARKLAELLRAGLLTEVQRPTVEEEAVRDLCRAREDAREDLQRCRHRLSKYFLRRGMHFSGRHWTRAHRRWIDSHTWAQARSRW